MSVVPIKCYKKKNGPDRIEILVHSNLNDISDCKTIEIPLFFKKKPVSVLRNRPSPTLQINPSFSSISIREPLLEFGPDYPT